MYIVSQYLLLFLESQKLEIIILALSQRQKRIDHFNL